MTPPTPGLRPLWNKSNTAVRVEIIVAAGDTLEVSDDVAAQLPASFAPVLSLDEARAAEDAPLPVPEPVVEDAPAAEKPKARKAKG